MINEIIENREVFEIEEDTVDDFDQLNQQYRKENEWMGSREFIVSNQEAEIIKSELDPVKVFKALQLPEKADIEKYTFETEYIPGKSDPFQRIMNLKSELIQTKEKIDEYADKFKNNEFIKETYNLGKVMDELEVYKSKVDAFINYDIFNNIHNPDFLESEADLDKSTSNNSSQDNIKNFTSNFEKYNRITENLLNIIKASQNDVVSGHDKYAFTYEILANPEKEIDNLTERINEMEDLINNLERTIGNWAINNNNQTLSHTLYKLLDFSLSKLNEKYDKKYSTFKECGSLISNFVEKRTDKLKVGSSFLKIHEIYVVLELQEEFELVMDYIKKRLRAIKLIYDNSDQFQINMTNIQNKVKSNQEKFQKLIEKYEETIKNFQEFDSILKEISEIDKILAGVLIG